MKARFRLFRRGSVYYSEDNISGKQESLRTTNKDEARTLLHAKNESHRQPLLNLQMARTYLRATDPEIATRAWQAVMEHITKTKSGSTRIRYERAAKDHALDLIRSVRLIDTKGEQLLHVLERGTVATNVFLRRYHNFALDMNWLPWPLIPKRQWPAVKFKDKRAITWEEHQRIVAAETNIERKKFYQLAWHVGGSQTDLANLNAEDIDWKDRVIAFSRKKTGAISLIHFGEEAAELLRSLPSKGPLFPYFRRIRSGDRSTEFKKRCDQLGISGISLHSYRYAWAERAKIVGMPERFAQEALGHNSKAVHRAYSKKAVVKVPSLEEYERKIVHLPAVGAVH